MPPLASGDAPIVSLIVVNYDGLAHLEPFFASVFAQSFNMGAVEVILVDNGSTDGSVAFVEERFPAVRILQNDRNTGFARPNNEAALVANGRYLALLNNDMRLEPDWLEKMVAYLEAAPADVVAAAGRIMNWDGSKIDFVGGALAFNAMGFQLHFNEPAAAVTPADWPQELLFACGGAMLIEREAFLDAGGFDDDYFAYFEDVDLGWRLWVLGYRVGFCGEAVCYHRHNGTSSRFGLAKKMVLMERNALYTLIKNYDDEHLQAFLPAALLLASKRIAARSGIERSAFAFSAPEQPSSKLRQLAQAYRSGGPKGMIKHALLKMATRIFLRFSSGDPIVIRPEAYSSIVAIEDLLDDLPRLLEKRRQLQARRKRPDAEILRLFHLPFHPIDPSPGYVRAHEAVVASMGLEALFANPKTAADPHGLEVHVANADSATERFEA